jgi:predicted DNA-binding protein YlxM (UPF0122 family)
MSKTFLTKELLSSLIEQECSPQDIADQLKVNRSSVYRALRRHKLKAPSGVEKNKQETRKKYKKVCELFSSTELSLKEIGKEFNMSPSAICMILKQNKFFTNLF